MSVPTEPTAAAVPAAAVPIEATAIGLNEKGEKGFWTATGEFFTDGMACTNY